MDIPVGFDKVQEQTVQEAAVGADLQGRLTAQKQQDLSNTLSGIAGVGKAVVDTMQTVRAKQATALDARVVAAADTAETEMLNASRDRTITSADMKTYEDSLRAAINEPGLAVPPGYRTAFDQTVSKLMAATAAKVAERNYAFTEKQQKYDLQTQITGWIDQGKSANALALIQSGENSQTLTPDEVRGYKARVSVNDWHQKVMSAIGEGTPAEIAKARELASTVLKEASLPADLRDSVYASLDALINRRDSENQKAKIEADKKAAEIDAWHFADLHSWAEYGRTDPKDPSGTNYMSLQDLATFKHVIKPERYVSLETSIHQRMAAQTKAEAGTAAVNYSLASNDYNIAKNTTNSIGVASDWVDKTLPPMSDFSKYDDAQRQQLVDLVQHNWHPTQVESVLSAGMMQSKDPAIL